MNIRQAFESHLATIANPLPTQYQNVEFTPVNGVPYQMATLQFAEPNDFTLALGGKTIEQGFFQVMLKYPTKIGVTVIEDKAYEIRSHFKKGTILINDDDEEIRVQIINTPRIKQLGVDGDRYMVAVTIPFYTQLKT